MRVVEELGYADTLALNRAEPAARALLNNARSVVAPPPDTTATNAQQVDTARFNDVDDDHVRDRPCRVVASGRVRPRGQRVVLR